MTTRVFSVHPNTPQEEVAHVVARYNLLAVPVIDDTVKLIGIVTIDDVIDGVHEENTEDMLKMAGTGDVNIASKSILKNTRARLPWLLASFVGGLVAVYVIGVFEVQLDRLAALAAFIPIVIGMGGNIGTQSSTIVVRGLATGEIDLKEAWKVLWREIATGAALGCVYGILLGAFAKVRFSTVEIDGLEFAWKFPIVVAIAICVNMLIAATIGTLIPMFLNGCKLIRLLRPGHLLRLRLTYLAF